MNGSDTVGELNNLAMWSLIVGSISPVVISAIQQPRWSDGLRAVVTAVFAFLVAIPTAAFAGDLEGRDYVSSALLILVSAISTYRNFWKPTGVSPSIEHKTSPKDRSLGHNTGGYGHGRNGGTDSNLRP